MRSTESFLSGAAVGSRNCPGLAGAADGAPDDEDAVAPDADGGCSCWRRTAVAAAATLESDELAAPALACRNWCIPWWLEVAVGAMPAEGPFSGCCLEALPACATSPAEERRAPAPLNDAADDGVSWREVPFGP